MAPTRDVYRSYEKALADFEVYDGLSQLVLNVYGLNAGKAMAIGNIVVTGNVVALGQET